MKGFRLTAAWLVAATGLFAASTYTVHKGETLSHIAQRYHIDVKQLCKLNGIDSKTTIKAGQTLKVPSAHAALTVRKKVKAAQIAKKKKKLALRKHKKATAAARIAKKKKLSVAALRIKGKTTIKRMRNVKVVIKHGKISKAIFAKKKTVRFKGHLPYLSKKVIAIAKRKLGRRYVWGAAGSNAFDCSGLTSYVYKKIGIRIPRVARRQARFGKYVPRSKLRPGDLVFFDTNFRRRGIDHVGIYLGNGKFIHASSARRRVIITSLNKPFYARRFRGGRRVL